jgi:hypothetical protein
VLRSQGTANGNGTAAQWESPWGLALSADNTRLYVTERTLPAVRAVAVLPPPSDVEWAVTSQLVGRDVGTAVAADAFGSAFVTGTRFDTPSGSWSTFVRKVNARHLERERGSGAGGLTREVETPLPSNSTRCECDGAIPVATTPYRDAP